MTIHRKATNRKRKFAKKLRRRQTKGEIAFWEIAKALREEEGAIFWRQVVLCGYVADFWCPKLRIVVEIDGPSHLEEAQIVYDEKRAKVMANQHGARTVRFTNFEVRNNATMVKERLRGIIRTRRAALG